MSIDVRKTLTDAGYVAVGLGVIGFQSVQVRRRELTQRLAGAGSRLAEQARDARGRAEARRGEVRARVLEARGRIEAQAKDAVERAREAGDEVGRRLEPLVERFVPESVRTRVRPGTAA